MLQQIAEEERLADEVQGMPLLLQDCEFEEAGNAMEAMVAAQLASESDASVGTEAAAAVTEAECAAASSDVKDTRAATASIAEQQQPQTQPASQKQP